MGSFRLGLVLGRGAMGEVYEAHERRRAHRRGQAAEPAHDRLGGARRAVPPRDGGGGQARLAAHREGLRAVAARRAGAVHRDGAAVRHRPGGAAARREPATVRRAGRAARSGGRALEVARAGRRGAPRSEACTTCSSTRAPPGRCSTSGCPSSRPARHADRRGHRRHAAVHGAGAGLGRAGHARSPISTRSARSRTAASPGARRSRAGTSPGDSSTRSCTPDRVRPSLLWAGARTPSRTCSPWRWPRIRGGGSRRRLAFAQAFVRGAPRHAGGLDPPANAWR